MKACALDVTSLFWNVMNWPIGNVGYPPAYFQVYGLYTAWDDVLVFGRALPTEWVVQTKLDMYLGLLYIFWINHPTHSKSV